MKIAILFPLIMVGISGCGGGDSEVDPSSIQSDPIALEPTPELEQPEQIASAITLDNHVDIVANVLAIFSGKQYGDDLLTAPDYSDPAYEGWPEPDGTTGGLISQQADIVCDNGGTLAVVPETTGYPSDNILTWHFDFDNCQDGVVLFDGQLSTAAYESVTLTATDFLRDDQTKVIRFSGVLSARSGTDLQSDWSTRDMKFSRQTSDGFLNIEDSNTSFAYQYGLTGEFMVQADWTDSQIMSVRVLEPVFQSEDVGKLELSFDSGNVLLFDAETGDVDTVDITITADGITSTITQPWALWSDNLIFLSESGL